MPRAAAKSARAKQTLFKLGAAARASNDPLAQAAYEKARRARYRDLFDTLLGREVLADILASCGYFAADTPHDEATANHRNGARWAAAQILFAMGADDADALTVAIINDDLNEVFT